MAEAVQSVVQPEEVAHRPAPPAPSQSLMRVPAAAAAAVSWEGLVAEHRTLTRWVAQAAAAEQIMAIQRLTGPAPHPATAVMQTVAQQVTGAVRKLPGMRGSLNLYFQLCPRPLQ